MAGTWATARKQVVAQARKGAQEVCEETARRILTQSSKRVPQVGKGDYSLGSLRASGYVSTPTKSGYEQAVDAAIAVPKTRIVIRNQIEMPENPVSQAGHARARVAYPLSYAKLIHDGFHHVRGNRRIAAVPFLGEAVEAEEGDFFTLMGEMINDQLLSIYVLTKADKQAIRDDKSKASYQSGEKRTGRSTVRRDAIPFSEKVEMSGEKLKPLRLPSGHMETLREAYERVVNAANHASGFDENRR